MTEPAVEVRGLHKSYGQVEAVRGIVLATSKSGTAIISPGPPRLGPDPKWDRRNALKVICRLVFEAAHQAH